jgi:hypothetical protein
MRKALFVTCLALAGAVVDPATTGLVPRAEAAVSVAYTLEELVDSAPNAVLAKAVEQRSQWEEMAGSRRIVTYTRLTVETRIYGGGETSLWVRTLGGVVDKIGQEVAGEASFQLQQRAVVFLTATRLGTLVVAGAAQGHFPVREADAKNDAPRLRPSPSLGTIVDRPGPRVTVFEKLVGKPLADAVSLVRATKASRDAKK